VIDSSRDGLVAMVVKFGICQVTIFTASLHCLCHLDFLRHVTNYMISDLILAILANER
jgi:hypothetical protein